MIEVEETESGLRVWDSANSEVFIETVGSNFTGDPYSIDRADENFRSTLSEMIFPADGYSIFDSDNDRWTTYGSRMGQMDLSPGQYTLQIHSSIVIYVRFYGSANIQMVGEQNELRLNFPSEYVVDIGFRCRFRHPTGKLSIPENPNGLAYAITQMSDCFETNSVDRSFPSMRDHPKQIELHENHDCYLQKDTSHLNGILFKVPNSFPELFVLSTLVHYLQADIVVDDTRKDIEISIPYHDYSLELPEMPGLERKSSQLLRRIFMLDCLVRDFGKYQTNLHERDLLERIGLRGDELYDEDPESRFVKYMNSNFSKISGDLLEWHLSMYVDPISSSIVSLPYILDRLSAIQIPNSKDISDDGMLREMLDDCTRSSLDGRYEQKFEVKKPILNDARTHGWHSDNVPIDAFKVVSSCFENRLRYQRNVGNKSKSIVVILNEHRMKDEFTQIYDIFSNESDHTNIELEIYEKPNTKLLKRTIEEDSIDFFHYIGHCDPDGLRCSDGNIPLKSLKKSSVKTFILNACGSYQEGIDLIKKGSVVGAVTLRPILDKPAAKVGETFARLVINGFSFSKGLELAREQILMKKLYSVVGDGTYRLTNGIDPFPIWLKIKQLSCGEYEMKSKIDSPQMAGSSYQPKLKGKEKFRLLGNETVDILSREELLEFLKESNSPVIYEDNLVWTDDVVERLE